MRIAVYPGSFDPVHLGHLDIIERAARVFDRVIVAVARNSEKEGLFTPAERLEMLEAAVGEMGRVEVGAFDGLTVEFARERGARVLVKGLRPVVDFEYELNQAVVDTLSGRRPIVRQTAVGERTLRIRAVPLEGAGGVAVAIQDVTELQRLGRARRDLVANISALTGADAPLSTSLRNLQGTTERLNGPRGGGC